MSAEQVKNGVILYFSPVITMILCGVLAYFSKAMYETQQLSNQRLTILEQTIINKDVYNQEIRKLDSRLIILEQTHKGNHGATKDIN